MMLGIVCFLAGLLSGCILTCLIVAGKNKG